MKKLLVMCCFFLGISSVSFAQDRTATQNRTSIQSRANTQNRAMRTPADQANRLKDSLKLNNEQTAKIKVIYEAQSKQLDSLRKAMDGNREGMREKFLPITTATNNKIKAVLTDQQKIAFQKQQDEMAARRRPR